MHAAEDGSHDFHGKELAISIGMGVAFKCCSELEEEAVYLLIDYDCAIKLCIQHRFDAH